MEALRLRIARRFLSEKKEVPAWSKSKERVVYVLPETLKDDSEEYERIDPDEIHHIEERGGPRKPAKPKKPRKPHKPEVPRAVHPAPVKPPQPPKRIKPIPRVKQVKPVKQPKSPMPTRHPRKWKVDKPELYRKEASAHRVVEKYLDE